MTPKLCTLLFLRKDNQILLAMKKRGFGSDRYNGVGGKVTKGESIGAATIRECQEEIGVTPLNLEKVAYHDFIFPEGIADIHVHTYICTEWEGEPTESDEMAPEWFDIRDIPYDHMWQDDIYWLPAVLLGKKLETKFWFNADETLTKSEITIVESFS